MTEEQAYDTLLAAYQAEVDFRHRKYTEDAEVKRNISHLAKFLTSQTSKFGAMFCGLPGNGKTTLLYAFRNALNFLNRCGMFEKNTGIMVIDARELSQRAKDFKDFRDLKSREMLAIEDMGREATEVLDFGNVLNPVEELIEYRYDAQLFTMITTNLTSDQIVEKYGKRVADRFNEMLEVIVFKNSTYRK